MWFLMTHTQADFDVFFIFQKLKMSILCKICSTDRHKKSCFLRFSKMKKVKTALKIVIKTQCFWCFLVFSCFFVFFVNPSVRWGIQKISRLLGPFLFFEKSKKSKNPIDTHRKTWTKQENIMKKTHDNREIFDWTSMLDSQCPLPQVFPYGQFTFHQSQASCEIIIINTLIRKLRCQSRYPTSIADLIVLSFAVTAPNRVYSHSDDDF